MRKITEKIETSLYLNR